MHEAADELESLAGGFPAHHPLLDVSWSVPYQLLNGKIIKLLVLFIQAFS